VTATGLLANSIDFTIARLGEYRVPSPMTGGRFVTDDERVLYPATVNELKRFQEFGGECPSMECAGAR